jgi:hypothetical protein
MKPLIVRCPSCSQGAQLDADRLPDRPVHFACPHCKEKVAVDKRRLLASQAGAAPQPPASTAPAPPAESAAAAAAPAQAPAETAMPPSADRRFARLPADATFPSGIILGEDEAAIVRVQEALSELGSEVELVGSADEARQIIVTEYPELCVYVGGQVAPPPNGPMAPLTGLPPSFRRRLFLVLVSENLKTLDGTSAFLYEVNMILGTRDLEQLGAALYSGIEYHERLYKPYFEAAERKGSI